jgi:hypothetical protein
MMRLKNILCSPWRAAASYPLYPSLEMKANQHFLLSQCNYSQAVEISMRALSLHDIDSRSDRREVVIIVFVVQKDLNISSHE